MPPITILTTPAEYDIEMATVGQLIQEWLKDFGVPITWKPMAFGNLLNHIRDVRDFDMFILGWRSLPIDPDYLKRFFYSSYEYPVGRNYTGYSDSEFDRMADLQTRELNAQARRKIVLDLRSAYGEFTIYSPLCALAIGRDSDRPI